LRRIAELYAKRTACGRNAEVLIAEATDQVERLLWLLGLRETECVGLDLRLDGGADLRRRAKEAVRRDRAVDALVRPLEVVVLDEKLDAPKTIGKISKHGLAKKLVP